VKYRISKPKLNMTNKTTLDFSDIETAINMRDWLQAACEKAGAKIVGGGVGREAADLDIELKGNQFAVSVKPFKRSHLRRELPQALSDF